MLNTPYFLLGSRAVARQRQAAQARRLRCPCGGSKDHEQMIVCLKCFQSAPVATQRAAYSRSPEVRRVSARELLAHARTRQANPSRA